MPEKSWLVEEAGNNNGDEEFEEEQEKLNQHSTKKSSSSAIYYSPLHFSIKNPSSQEIPSDVIVEPTTNLLPIGQPQPRHRSTRLELADTLRKIRYLIGQAYTNEEIMSMLNLSPATFYRYLAKIHAQDRELFLQQDIGAIEFEVHNLKDKLIRAERWYNKMADDESLGPGYRLQAKYSAADAAFAILKLTNAGLENIDKVRRFAKTGKMMPQEFPELYDDNAVDRLDGRSYHIDSTSRDEEE